MFIQYGHHTGNIINRTFEASRPSKLAAAVRITGDFYDDGRVKWRNQSGATIHNIHLDNSDGAIEYGGERIRDHNSDTWYYIELKQIDWENNTIGKITVDGTVEKTDIEFLNPANNISEVEISINGAGTGSKVFVDNLKYSGKTNENPIAGPDTLPGFDRAPTDPDSDGLYEDANGDGGVDIADAQALFEHFDDPAVQEDAAYFDFNEDGSLDIADIQYLYNNI